MRSRSLKLAALCLLLWFPAFWPAPHAHTEIRSLSVGQPIDWTPLATATSAREAWYAALRLPAPTPPAPRPVALARYGTGACGGTLPPCSVLACESHGNLTAQNPHSTASGKWQILDSTWAGYGGYSRAMYAPEEVQDERARQIYAGGAGRSAWVC